jgi:hypothetical protein
MPAGKMRAGLRFSVTFAAVAIAGGLAAAPALAGGIQARIWRFAGTGVAGVVVPGAATNSPLDAPRAVATDYSNATRLSGSNVYVVDANHEVEEINAAGRLSVIAGTGVSGAPVPGPALGSPLGNLLGVAVNPSTGDVFVADASNNVVEEITPGGTLSIFAGGGQTMPSTASIAATGAMLRAPSGVGVDPAGDLFIADSGNNMVEKVTTSGMLSTFAGTGVPGAPTNSAVATTSKLNSPDAVAVDDLGNVDVADAGNFEVDQVNTSGDLTILAGDGQSGEPSSGANATVGPLGTPRGLGFDTNDLLYVADADNSTVWLLAGSPTQISRVFGTGVAGVALYGQVYYSPQTPLNQPSGFARALSNDDASGRLIADTGNNTIDLITSESARAPSDQGTGTVAPTVVGDATQGQTLTADPGSWIAADGFAYQWQSCAADASNCVDIPGATSYTYVPVASDVGHPIRFVVTASNTGSASAFFSPTTATSPVTGSVAPAAAVNTAPPAITGSAIQGQTLTASNGIWTGNPSSFSYQWQDCNASGGACVDIPGATSGTYTVGVTDVGLTIEVVVTATNLGGPSSARSAPTSIVAAIPGPAPTTPAAARPVTLGPVPSAGVHVSGSGRAVLSVVCPQTSAGCDASGVLTIHLPKPLDARAASVAAAHGTVLARFSGKMIASGHSALVTVRLSPTVFRRLQSLHIRRVKVTLSLSNHLTGGPAVSSTQTLYLLIPPLSAAGCADPTGQLNATSLGAVTLGATRARTQRVLPRFTVRNYHTDDFCLFGGPGVRVGYASARLLGTSPAAKQTITGTVLLALTANRLYTLRGVRPGARLAAVAHQLKLAGPVHAGLNDWYVVPGATNNGLLKVRNGVILEVGIVNKQLTNGPVAQHRLLRNF